MSDKPLPIDHSFIPREQRASHNVGFGDYIWKLLKAALITKGAALVGGFAGGKAYGKNGAKLGYIFAGVGTGMYEAYIHWKPIKGTQERVEALLPEVLVELNPETLQQETKLQQEIQKGLQERQKLFTELVEKRDAIPSTRSNGAVDALEQEASATAPQRF